MMIDHKAECNERALAAAGRGDRARRQFLDAAVSRPDRLERLLFEKPAVSLCFASILRPPIASRGARPGLVTQSSSTGNNRSQGTGNYSILDKGWAFSNNCAPITLPSVFLPLDKKKYWNIFPLYLYIYICISIYIWNIFPVSIYICIYIFPLSLSLYIYSFKVYQL